MIPRWLAAIVLLCLMAVSPARAAPADDGAALEAKWSDALAKWDIDALAALYTKDALIIDSAPELYVGQDGVKTYFSKLPKGVFKLATFSDQHVIRLTGSVIVAAGFVTFTREANGQTSQVPFRITLTLLRVGKGWKLAAHHTASKGT
jgi:ketosteroid isomerase-like protein